MRRMPWMQGPRRRRARAFAVAIPVASCDKSIVEPSASLPAIEAANVDAAAGAWKMIVLTGPDQVVVPDPAPVTSAAYLAELQSLKTAQSNMTDAQRAAVQYWTGAGVLRWNEIERELVARYNLPPAPRADGSYPLPDAENPFSDPVFPFASPPYAARAYAYVGVAQYEALKAAWVLEVQVQPTVARPERSGGRHRRAPSTLPSYPSEDAVLSG
jgi:hypothetical protein